MTNAPTVLTTLDARGIAHVTLNRPEANNAYDGAMLEALCAAVARAASDPAIRLVVIRGNGRHFQAGADLRWLREVSAQGPQANHAASRLTARAMRELDALPKPTIALVHGACIGGGTGLAASCDVVLAERTASFAISEARWGVAATIIFPQLNAAIGVRQVRRYAASCETFDAARARELGLVHEVCEPGGLDAAAAPIVDALLAAAPGSIALSKLSAMRCAGSLFDDDTFERLVREHADKRQSDEAREGLAAFAEKRPPGWARPT
jgi:methylglutaconyl-CoA hydratase